MSHIIFFFFSFFFDKVAELVGGGSVIVYRLVFFKMYIQLSAVKGKLVVKL